MEMLSEPDKRSRKWSPSTDKLFKRQNKTGIIKNSEKLDPAQRPALYSIVSADQIKPSVIFLLTHLEIYSILKYCVRMHQLNSADVDIVTSPEKISQSMDNGFNQQKNNWLNFDNWWSF